MIQNTIFSLDASAILYGWENYPKDMLANVWEWVEKAIKQNRVVILDVSYKETKNKYPECSKFLDQSNIQKIKLSSKIIAGAETLKESLEIENDKYQGEGVGENDLLIIAHAQSDNLTLITQEGKQKNKPKVKANYKIPLVCDENGIKHFNFLEFLTSIHQLYDQKIS